MVFSSLSFLIVFLPVLCVLFFIFPAGRGHIRQYLLLLFSLVFYATGEPLYIFLIIGCILITWLLSRYVEKRKRTVLAAAVLVNVIPLIVTKYSGFLADNINAVLGNRIIQIPRIVMPIGISFYTFQVITYMVDLYRGKVERQKNPLLFALYIMFFPQLIAGPILKYEEIQKELACPDISWENIRYGTGRFITGIGKKVLLANQAGHIASAIQSCDTSALTPGMTWLCVAAYTVQIYFDFSGYSEMAIGLGSIFGFHFPENFRDPYTSKSITEFWRRWHITLGRFFREYVYIPLGGNRVTKARWILNIFIVWTLTGLWHGAAWNFIIWGLYYGILIVFEKITGISKKIPGVLGWIITLLLVMIGWGIFMCDSYSIGEMTSFLGRLFFIGGNADNPATVASLKLWGDIPFLAAGILLASPLYVTVRGKCGDIIQKDIPVAGIIHDGSLIAILLLSILFLIGGTYNPFIYFRF